MMVGKYVAMLATGNGNKELIAVADTLDGARDAVMDHADFVMLKTTRTPGEWSSVIVDSNSKAGLECFRWYEENTCGGRYPSRFDIGNGEMTAYFQDECTNYSVELVEYKAR